MPCYIPPKQPPLQENILSLLEYYDAHLDNVSERRTQINSGQTNYKAYYLVVDSPINVGAVLGIIMGVEELSTVGTVSNG